MARDLVGADGLTRRQRGYVRAVLEGLGPTEAARAAGYAGSDETVRVRGAKLAEHPSIVAALERLRGAARAAEVAAAPAVPGAREREAVLDAIDRGAPEDLAARAAGVGVAVLDAWRAADEAFGRELRRRSAAVELKALDAVRSGEGDWRSVAWWLERAHAERWGAKGRGPKPARGTVVPAAGAEAAGGPQAGPGPRRLYRVGS